MIKTFDELSTYVQTTGVKKIAIANANDEAALTAFIEARQKGFVDGILFGDKQEIQNLLKQLQPGMVDEIERIHTATDDAAVREAVRAVSNHQADILMKGKTKTSQLLKTALDPEIGLRTGRLLSDAFVFENPQRRQNKLTIITDGGVTLKPDLSQKIQIIQNAVELAHLLGNENPKVALLSAVETVVPGLQATMDAAILAKMNQRGQIPGCIIDGPLALDNAISPEALRIKKIDSVVAGDADILVPPEIESANLLAKSTTYWAKFRLGHVIMGAKAPILIPSRADTSDAKLLSIILGCVVCGR